MKITKKQMKGGLHEMKYKQLAMAVVGMMLILSTFSSLNLVSAQEDEGQGYAPEDMQDEPNIWGADKYEVKIEGFMGYNDPFSRRSWETMQQLHDEFGDRITFIWRNYPFEFNDAGYKVAQAGECVLALSNKGTFFKYSDYIMNLDYSERLDAEEAIEIADDLGLDIRECVEEDKFLPEVGDDRFDGIKKGEGELGTPTFFIGTKQINGAQPYSIFQEIIKKQLGDDNDGGEQSSLWEGDGFALNEDESKGFLAELNLEKDEEGKVFGTMYVFRDKYRVQGVWQDDDELIFELYPPWENGEMVWASSGRLTEFGDFLLFKGNLKPADKEN